MKPIKIVSYNTYLIADRFNKNRMTYPEERASKIHQKFLLSPPPSLSSLSSSPWKSQNCHGKESDKNNTKPDLCFFQEVWGSGISELTKNTHYSISPRRSSFFSSLSSVSDSGQVTNQNREIEKPKINSLYDTMKEMVNMLYFHWLSTGGLYDLSDPSMACMYRSKHTFTVSRSKSKKGVEATLWDVPKWQCFSAVDCDQKEGKNKPTVKMLLVFNTHLDPWNVANRRKQIREIIEFMEDTMQSIERRVMVSRTTLGGDSVRFISLKDQEANYEYDWSQTAVLVVGDFNIKAGSEEYWETFRLLESISIASNASHSWKDFFLLSEETDDNIDQHTYALQNSLVEYPEDCGRIDYIFGISSFVNPLRQESLSEGPQKESTSRTFMQLNEVSRSIRKEQIGVESSDHYALILELIPVA